MDPTLPFDPAIDVPDRDEVPDAYRWDYEPVFRSPDDWEREFEAVADAVDDLRTRERAVTGDGEYGGDALLAALETYHALERRRGKLGLYAELRTLEDATDDEARAAMGRFERLTARIEDAASFLEPAVQEAGRERIEALVDGTDGLEPYEHYLDRILRRAAHTRSQAVESVLADLERSLESPARVLRELQNEDFEPPTVETPGGETATVTPNTYSRLLEREDREFRRRVHEAYVDELERTRAASARAYADRIETNVRLADLRNYDSALGATLEGTLPVEVYDAVVDGLREQLEPFHRHLELYDRATDGEELRLWDLHVPLAGEAAGSGVPGGDGSSVAGDEGTGPGAGAAGPTVPYDEACEIVVDAVAPLGTDYRDRLESFLAGDRVDVYETTAKRSNVRGMNVPTYDVGSYVLLNYKRDLRSLYFFAHELGHVMHKEYYRSRPTVYDRYPDHLVEIPSFVHEALLTDHLLESYVDDATERRHVLATALDKLPLRIGAHWSAFVRDAHAVVEGDAGARATGDREADTTAGPASDREDGGQLTAGRFDELYGELQAEFLEPVTLREADERYWLGQNLAREPYFSYVYLLGMTGGLAVVRRLLGTDDDRDRERERARYREFLRAGRSEYPTDQLETLGVDFASGRPVERALETYEGYVDELADALA